MPFKPTKWYRVDASLEDHYAKAAEVASSALVTTSVDLCNQLLMAAQELKWLLARCDAINELVVLKVMLDARKVEDAVAHSQSWLEGLRQTLCPMTSLAIIEELEPGGSIITALQQVRIALDTATKAVASGQNSGFQELSQASTKLQVAMRDALRKSVTRAAQFVHTEVSDPALRNELIEASAALLFDLAENAQAGGSVLPYVPALKLASGTVAPSDVAAAVGGVSSVQSAVAHVGKSGVVQTTDGGLDYAIARVRGLAESFNSEGPHRTPQHSSWTLPSMQLSADTSAASLGGSLGPIGGSHRGSAEGSLQAPIEGIAMEGAAVQTDGTGSTVYAQGREPHRQLSDDMQGTTKVLQTQMSAGLQQQPSTVTTHSTATTSSALTAHSSTSSQVQSSVPAASPFQQSDSEAALLSSFAAAALRESGAPGAAPEGPLEGGPGGAPGEGGVQEEVHADGGVVVLPNSQFALPLAQYNVYFGGGALIDASELEFQYAADGSLAGELGRGASGVVYRAVRGGVQRVAVKLLEGRVSERRRMEFLQEMQLLQACRDRHIVQFYGAVVDEQRLMMVMELMEGGTLFDAIANDTKKEFSWYKRGRSIALDIARGLAYLHGRSPAVLHFDLKSANVLLTRDKRPKIADVGFSQTVKASSYVAVSNARGTFAWSAPELLLGESCTTAADIFSVGVILWEIVTGQQPVRGAMHLPSPDSAPPEVLQLITACRNPNPALRPTAKQVLATLEQAIFADMQLQRSRSTPTSSAPKVAQHTDQGLTARSHSMSARRQQPPKQP